MIRAMAAGESIDGVACRGARSMIGLSQSELCELAGCGRKLLNDFENGIRVPSLEKVLDIRLALESVGARFFTTENGTAVTVVAGSAYDRSARARGFAPDRQQ